MTTRFFQELTSWVFRITLPIVPAWFHLDWLRWVLPAAKNEWFLLGLLLSSTALSLASVTGPSWASRFFASCVVLSGLGLLVYPLPNVAVQPPLTYIWSISMGLFFLGWPKGR
ncbi:MAG: hypothetical protein O3C46_06950 [Bacteroidetes bacterium]|jgi:hypothetical protein|nr:hypothetical protein [Bacteroidota bacterium]MDA0929752.1 hypothetical protein [Bacteroidota bacterium]